MITFKHLLRGLNEVTIKQSIFDDLDELLDLIEGTFYVYRSDNNSVLAKGIPDFESAKARASQLRKSLNLTWDQVKFKMERKPGTRFGVSRDGGNSQMPIRKCHQLNTLAG